MKDTIKLNLTPNPSNNDNNNNDNNNNNDSNHGLENGSSTSATLVGSLEKELKSQFICPVSMKEMNGKHRFVYLDSCGCVFAEQTLKEVNSKECLSCGKPFDSTNSITINPTNQTEIDAMTKVMEERKSKQKDKKKKKRQLEEKEEKSNHIINKKKKTESTISSSTAASIVMDKVKKELAEKEKNKKESSAIKSLYADKNQPTKVKGNYLTMGTFNRYC
ncbi:unnamed protein product [Cunninghamella blakesleeana]